MPTLAVTQRDCPTKHAVYACSALIVCWPLLLLLLLLLLLQEFGQLDILVSNAAVNPTAGPLVDTPAGARTARSTAFATSLLLQHVAPAHSFEAPNGLSLYHLCV
jgi:NAD(P)-dependent dehydrogenase (short-subunit alcohol dehydrogenase family)